jgi:hypothetical protein
MAIGRIPEPGTGIPESIIAAKGDILTGTANDTPAVLSVGTNGHTLVANSSTATGLEWQAASSGGANWSLLNAGGTALTGAQTVTVSGISGKDKIMVLVAQASSVNALVGIGVRFNTDTANNYYSYGSYIYVGSTYSAGNFGDQQGASGAVYIAATSTTANGYGSGYCILTGANSSGVKSYQSGGSGWTSGGTDQTQYNTGGYYNSASTISSISIFSTSGNLDAGTVFVYTSA